MNPGSIGIQNAGEQLNQMKATAESLFSNQLASALSTISDSQFFQDSISPSTIRSQFSSSEPSNPSSTPVLMNSMKWLLASMSKGRDVSDFFSHVVKLVSCPSLEIRKMVYTYLTHYADHDVTCRDLALLSINAFQRDLSNSNDNIRPLALRVLTSIRVMDVLQIQILAVQTCSKDSSPHVRKCATNALAKLYPRSDDDNKHRLKEMLRNILLEENSTIVLSSAVVSFVEICPNELDMLHGCYRKLCHLLTDIEEWGQIICLDVLARYCRTFFRSPEASNGIGSAEKIDRQRRISRGIGKSNDFMEDSFTSVEESGIQSKSQAISTVDNKKKEKRRIIKKGFYSDEEDESTEEDESIIVDRSKTSLASRMRSPSELNSFGNIQFGGDQEVSQSLNGKNDEDAGLDEDHRLLLNSSLPLLKSRNSGVVLGVCSLHYHCGIASVKIRSSLGKALVRIYHDRREIQYIVLNSIRMLAQDCPSAFTPYLNDFFVKAMDPSFTRMIKLDILVSLCLEENSINAVLNELKTYIRNTDKNFVCASIRALGKLVEMAKIFYSRQGIKTGNAIYFQKQANQLALNCLHGLTTLIEVSDNHQVIGQSIEIMQHILQYLSSQENVEDPFHTRGNALHKILLLFVKALITEENIEEDKQNDNENGKMHHKIPILTSNYIVPALWTLGEWLLNDLDSMHIPKIGKAENKLVLSEVLRLLADRFADMDQDFKCQCVHFAGKALVSKKCSTVDEIICEFILGLGRVDVNLNVRDRSRNISHIVHLTKGLVHDIENVAPRSVNCTLSIDDAKAMLLQQKPESSWIPLEGGDHFRFGTLTSMVSHVTGTSYIELPPWAKFDSKSSLRDPPIEKKVQLKTKQRSIMGTQTADGWTVDVNRNMSSTFYDSEDSSDDSSSSSDDTTTSSSDSDSGSSSSSSSSSEGSASSEDSSYEDNESTSSDESARISNQKTTINDNSGVRDTNNSSNDSSSDSSIISDDSSTSENDKEIFTGLTTSHTSNMVGDLLNIPRSQKSTNSNSHNQFSSISDELEGLVMSPIVISKDKVSSDDLDEQSSKWEDVIRNELSGGLSMKLRFLRSSVRSQEASRMGLDAKISSVVCAQIMFENKRTDGLAIRRIKFIQKRANGTGCVDISNVVLPQEISSLDGGKVCVVLIGIQFSNPSDKEGAMVAKFDVKCDRSTTAIELKPPLAEMIQSSSITNIESFEKAVKRLSGTYQKSRSNILIKDKDQVMDKILSSSTITLVHGWVDNVCRFAGTLPVSSLDLLLEISYSPEGSSEMFVYCDDAMAVNSLLVFFRDVLKNV